jgi:hypothetical protein
MGGRPFALIGVNVGGCTVEQLRSVMTKENLTWRSFADPGQAGAGAIARKWSLLNTPTLYLVDDLGVIRNKWVAAPGAEVLDAAVEKWTRAAEERTSRRAR